jgi:tetratricopeptide (TPR) repeat protein
MRQTRASMKPLRPPELARAGLVRRLVATNSLTLCKDFVRIVLVGHYCRELIRSSGRLSHRYAAFNKGATLLKLKRPSEALEAYDSALALDPKLFQAAFNKCQLLLDLQRNEQAAQYCETATAAFPDAPQLWLKQAIALLRVERHSESLGASDMALKVDESIADAWYYKSSALASLNRTEEALEGLYPGATVGAESS